MTIKSHSCFLAALALLGLLTLILPVPAHAEDCTGPLPFANCTLDENTTAPLGIDLGITLTISAGGLAPGELNINHTIDGNTVVGKGDIVTVGNGGTIIQNADVGGTNSIIGLDIGAGDSWFIDNDADLILEPPVADMRADGGFFVEPIRFSM